jgi:hypothetical protein
MLKHNNKIIWEKWIDPYLAELPETEWPDFNNASYTEEEEYDDEEEPTKHSMYAISSPMGLIPYNEYNASSKIFNFWMGHTNFDITQKVSDAIEKTPGIEILDVFTRYRFRIAIGKSFKDRDVMGDVNNNIRQHFYEQLGRK